MDTASAMRLLLSNRQLFMETLMEVEDKNRQLVPFKLTPIQADMHKSSTGRDVYLKPGQVGATTYHIADFLVDNLTLNGTVSVVISYDEWVAQRQLLKARKFYQALKRRIPTIPTLGHKSTYELSFEDTATGFYSSFYIYSARSYTLGRGEAIHNLLMDEYAFWEAGTHEDIFASAVQRVPLLLGTKIRILSTPNGEDNPFHEVYVAAKEGKQLNQSVYTHHFYPWYIHPEYQLAADNPFTLSGDEEEVLPNLTADEVALMRRFELLGITEQFAYDKLRWRRYKKVEMMSLRRSGQTMLMFEQEYPEDDVTCFITAGDMAYDSEIVSDKLRNCYPPIRHRVAVNKLTGVSVGVDVWADVEAGLPYILSIDPGKGKTSESVGQVWTFKEGFNDKDGHYIPPEMKHCATLCGFYDEPEMAEYCKDLGMQYNEAVIAPEDNLDIVSHLRNYPNLYYREDTRDGRVNRTVGWQTNISTKPYMISELSSNLPNIVCHDRRFWEQLRNVRRDANSRSGVTTVGMEDHHMAGGIAIVCRTAQAVQRGYVGSSGWDDNWGR